MPTGKILVAGSLAQRPGVGGHAWVYLQYLLGFQRLGFEVMFLDRLDPEMCVDKSGARSSVDQSWNLEYLREIMEGAGLGAAWSLDSNGTQQTFGRSLPQVLAHAREADLLLNVMGFLTDPEVFGLVRRRAFLDIDPGFGQMWQDLKLARLFESHDVHITIGENIGNADCIIPTCGLKWVTTPQPVVLDCWPCQTPDTTAAFSTVASWRGPFGPIEYEGKTYGLRVHEFRKFAALPRLTPGRFDLALEIDSADVKDRLLLESNGWRLLDPRAVAGTPDQYQQFIRAAKAEIMIAKNMYVATRGGWFSDRSACYLASGKPVLAQDTGLSPRYPTGAGLLTFATLEEAAAGVEAICADYARHARAAHELAEAYFDSDKVLTRLLDEVL